MWEGYGGAVYTHDPANFDGAIAQFSRWMSVRPNGRARYGILTQYGTCGTNNVGHPLTAHDERIALALATIGGVDLWAVHDCNWGTTVVPGGQFSIPEMGDSPGYPRRLAGPADVCAGEDRIRSVEARVHGGNRLRQRDRRDAGPSTVRRSRRMMRCS